MLFISVADEVLLSLSNEHLIAPELSKKAGGKRIFQLLWLVCSQVTK